MRPSPCLALAGVLLLGLPAVAAASPERVRFTVERASLFAPAPPGSDPEEWYWQMDGLTTGGTARLFALRLKPRRQSRSLCP